MAEGQEPREKSPQEKPLRPRQCHKYLQKTLARDFKTIVNGFISEAEKGSCAHMKLAVELLEPVKADGRTRKGSVQMLLEQLGE
jgi:hypothetical protein